MYNDSIPSKSLKNYCEVNLHIMWILHPKSHIAVTPTIGLELCSKQLFYSVMLLLVLEWHVWLQIGTSLNVQFLCKKFSKKGKEKILV
jgi:hypothetical protein